MGASRSVEEVELEGYFVAALAFIDPQLSAESPLAEVEAAAARRMQALSSLPPQLAEGDINQLNEALDFARRYYSRLHANEPTATAADEEEVRSQIAGAGGSVVAELELSDDLELEVTELQLPSYEHTNGNGNGNGSHANGNGLAIADAAVSEPQSEVIEPAGEPEPAFERRHSPLRKLWDEVECEAQGECALPEQQALPVARGLLLLAFEAWLAGFAGWVATRFMAWPREGVGYEVSTAFGHVIVLVGVATFAVAAWLVWRYRAATRRVSLLIHSAGVLLALDLLAWKLAAAPGNVPVIDAPTFAMWELLIAGWLIGGVVGYLADMRATT